MHVTDAISIEHARLASLDACMILGTPRDPSFDSIVFTVAQIFRCSLAMLTLVDSEGVWVKAHVGPVPLSFRREGTFCDEVVRSGAFLFIEDARAELRFASMNAVSGPPRVRFVAGAPLLGPGGQRVGALCAMDPQPHTATERQRFHMRQLAAQAGELLCLRVPDLDVTKESAG